MDLVKHLVRQQEFSFRVFGPRKTGVPLFDTAGVRDHLHKELVEVANAPADITEWIDIAILAFDGAMRAGHEPLDIARALAEKQAINEMRSWPDWRTAEPGKAIEHIRTPHHPPLTQRPVTETEILES